MRFLEKIVGLSVVMAWLCAGYLPMAVAGSGDGVTSSERMVAKVRDWRIPGAIVCNDHDTVRIVAALYRGYADANLRASVTGDEQEKLLHGKAAVKPNPEKYGCVLLQPGTSMTRERSWPAVISVILPNGKVLRGVTDPSMIGSNATESSRMLWRLECQINRCVTDPTISAKED